MEMKTISIKFFSTLRSIMKMESTTIQAEKNLSLFELFNKINESIFLPKNFNIFSTTSCKELAPGILCLIDEVDYQLWSEDSNDISEIDQITFISSLHGG